jgi:microcin C transport system substrate-binding protein
MTEAVAEDEATLRISFSGRQSDRTILDVATFPILSEAYFEKVPFDSSRLELPLGSGPYKVGLMRPGQTIEYERVADYWGRDLPVNRGLYNFDRLRIEFYGDRQAAFEAFKKGEVHFREEATSRIWATGYDFPAIHAGKVVKREFPSERRPSMQASALNQRRERFRDVRVRRAVALCFDFEWTNKALFYGLYERSQSCFEKSDFKASGLPDAAELALLEPLRAHLPPEVFGEAWTLPPSDGSGRDRKLLREARGLMTEAGWKPDGSALRNAAGEAFRLEILVDDEGFVRIYSPWVENMRAIGIDASIRMVDSAQHQARQADFDFDMISMAVSFQPSPTREGMDGIFHSRSAALNGSRNLPGTADPAVDALVEAIDRVADRDQLTTVMRALDRVLRVRMDWIPSWYSANRRVAFWDMFGFREPKPDYGFAAEALWWFDKDKAAAIGKG